MPNTRGGNRRSVDSGTESFMDLASPTSPTGPWEGGNGVRAREGALRLPKINTSRGGSTLARGDKPPLPTSPKPDFGERRSMSVERRARHKAGGEGRGRGAGAAPSRAELVRKSRKLAQVFGQTPSPLAVYPPGAGQLLFPGVAGKAHRRGFTSVSGDSMTSVSHPPSPLTVPASRAASRRHSTPFSPSDLAAFPDMFEASAVPRPSKGKGRREMDSDRSSFIDLSEEDSSSQTAGDESDAGTVDDAASMLTMTPSELAEDERRRKREKLAKLHRFLGSRVPASLVLGLNYHQLQQQDNDLPQLPQPAPIPGRSPSRRPRRRRSSSAAEMKTNWFEPNDRAKDFLDDKEKAIIVRRAVKMEKVFGVQPPQTLYHTRPSATLPIPPPPRSPSPRPPPLSPITFRRMSTLSLDRTSLSSSPSPSPGLPLSPTTRNINQSAYINKRAHHRSGRHSPTESTHHLLDYDSDDFTGHQHSNSTSSDFGARPVADDAPDGQSAVYMHFRHSLNSLNDILDRDDKESLAELHRYLISDTASPGTDDFAPTPTATAPAPDPDARALRSERRRSLPARASMLSLASQFSIAPPEPQMAEFQARRRRAAKLTSFFGVDYRELIGDILESIETGVQEEGSKGALHPAEVQDLLQKLRKLKTKRPGTCGA